MPGFVDIHTHLLPGIDDGPVDLAGALDMARAAVASGSTTIAATPHLRADFPDVHVEELADRCRKLGDALDQQGVPVRVVSGAEVSLLWALDASEEELRLASYGQRGSDLLVETPTDVTPLEALLYRLRAQGYRITLAHPERSRVFQRDAGRLRSLTDHGVLLQINAGSLQARTDASIRKLAERLCREGLAQVIASDGHRAEEWRAVTALAVGVEAATALVGRARAEWMASTCPRAIIEGAVLPEAPEIETTRRRWLRRR